LIYNDSKDKISTQMNAVLLKFLWKGS